MKKNHGNNCNDRVSVSIGLIVQMNMGKGNAVQYKILYRDQFGREHSQWSDWMRYDGYEIDDSIPVQTASVPGTFGLITVMKEVDGHPQKPIEAYAATMVLCGIGALLAGYHIGKDKK